MPAELALIGVKKSLFARLENCRCKYLSRLDAGRAFWRPDRAVFLASLYFLANGNCADPANRRLARAL